MAVLAIISTAFESAIPESLHFHPFRRLKMAVRPCAAGNANGSAFLERFDCLENG